MKKPVLVLGAIILLGFLLKLLLIFSSQDFLISNLIPDDSFYYFKTAQNIALGHGSTFDGVHSANGYHPLWMVLILPFFAWLGLGDIGSLLPIQASLVLSALFDVCTLIALLCIVRRYTQKLWIQAGVSLFWIFNPFIIYETLSGLETSVSLFLITLTLLCVLRLKDSASSYILLGVLSGFLMLARLDNLIYFLGILLFVFLYSKNGFKRVLLTGFTASIVVIPWLIWNVSQFGSLLTSSSAAFTMYQHQLIVQDHGPGLFQKIKAAVYMAEHGFQTVLTQTGAPTITLLLIGIGIALLFRGLKDKKFVVGDFWKRPEAFFFGSWISLFLIHTVLRFGYRTWYFISLNIFLVLFGAFILNLLEREEDLSLSRRKLFLTLALFGFLTVSSFFVSWSQDLRDRERAQREMVSMAYWANDNLPEGSIIGVFNSGVQGYFSRHKVVNLDGLINQSAYEAMKERKLWKYIEDEGITHISDFDIYLSYRYKNFLGIEDPFSRMKLLHSVSLGEHGRSGERPGIHLSLVLKENKVK